MSMTPQQYYSTIERPLTMQLPYENATNLSLAFLVNTGSTVDLDWGDGVVVTVNADGNYNTKNFGTPTTGIVTIYRSDRLSSYLTLQVYAFWKHSVSVFKKATGLGRFYAYGNITGDISLVPKSVYNLIIGGTGVFTGTADDIQPLMQSFQCISTGNTFTATSSQLQTLSILVQYRVLGNSIFTGDINTLPTGLVILSLKNTGTPLHEISYTNGRIWASNMRVVELLPKPGFGLTTVEVDNLLIDLSQTTWTNEKFINIAGNNAQRSVASDEAKAALQAMGVSVTVNEPSAFYVRPTGTTYGTGDGTSYANAWSGFGNVNWASVENNRLAVCGNHSELLTVGADNCNIRFNDINESGAISGGDTLSTTIDIDSKIGVVLDSPIATDATTQCLFIRGNAVATTNNGVFSGSGNQAIQHYDTCTAIHNNLVCDDNVDDGISGHNSATITVNTGTFSNNIQSGVNTIEDCNTIINNGTFINNLYDVWSANASSAESNVITVNNSTLPNIAKATNLSKVVLNGCNTSNVTLESTSYAELNTSVIDTLIVGANTVIINNCRLNDINSISSGGFVEITDSYVKPVGVFDNNGTLRLLRTLFDSSDCTDHTIDNNSGAVFKAQYCMFRNPIAGKYALSIRTGSTVEALEGITLSGTSNLGRGIYSQIAITAKNTIITGLDVGVTVAVSGQDITLEKGCLFDNTTTANGSGALIQNDMQNTDPLFTDEVNEDYSLQVGSDCIGNGETLTETEGFDTVDWGDSSTIPTITTQTLSVFNIGAI